MNRNVYTIIGILAILRSGGAYLPVDSEYPDDRIMHYMEDSGTGIIVTTTEYINKIGSGYVVIPVDVEEEDAVVYDAVNANVQPSDLCYIIYTSGTTGKPKGVMIEHRNVVRLFFNDEFQFNFGQHDVWAMFHSHCFDFSVWEIFGALLFGGRLIIIPRELAKDTAAFLNILKEEKVTVLNQTPGSFYNVVREEMLCNDASLSLRYVIFGGEALSPAKLLQWKIKYPDTRLINMFGITETTVHVTYKEIGEQEIKTNCCNIGKPIPATSVYLFDQNMQPVPKGVTGEIYVGGSGVARGYCGNRALTQKKFIDNPYNPGEKLYCSGDLARRLISGDLEYLGRIDHQVQLRGFRIELGEIESYLAIHPAIRDVVVTVREKQGNKFLVAHYIPVEEITGADLKSYLLDKLPDYMVPAYFVSLDKMPLTQNGKLDREALPDPKTKTSEAATAPSNEVEEVLASIWAEVLGTEPSLISMNDSFFEIGGHSLLAPILISMISDKLTIRFHLKVLYQYPTIRAFAGYYLNNCQAEANGAA